MKEIYHSALKAEQYTEKDIVRMSMNGNTVFVHDITEGLPEEFDVCDILYSEPSWLDGYVKFLERAEKPFSSTYGVYIQSLWKIIERRKTPVVLLTGKHAIGSLPPYDSTTRVKLHGYMTDYYAWGLDISRVRPKNGYELIGWLSERYGCVGDFCCGYGNTGRIFQERGKHWVMSDINAKCVTYIARNL